MLVGFESFNAETLKQYHKGINAKNLADYQTLVNGFHRAGISMFGGFIIGADADTAETVADTAIASVELGIDIIQITNLTPLPGTKMYDRFMEEGKIFATNYPEDWERYTFVETVYNPVKMTAHKLDEVIYELRHAAATTPWVWFRTLRTLWMTRSFTSAAFIHGMNTGWKRLARMQLPKDEERFGFRPRKNHRTRKIIDSFWLRLNRHPAGMNGSSTNGANGNGSNGRGPNGNGRHRANNHATKAKARANGTPGHGVKLNIIPPDTSNLTPNT
jgi:hypothetical protein